MVGEYKYYLPCHPSQTCSDRFSILDSDEIQVPVWNVLKTILTRPLSKVTDVYDLLDTISLTLHDKPCPSYDSLAEAITSFSTIHSIVGGSTCIDTTDAAFLGAWPSLKEIALELPSLFSRHELTVLPRSAPRTFTRREIACLLVHMFLGTISSQPWARSGRTRRDEPGPDVGQTSFTSWYPRAQAAPNAVKAYLSALMAYIARITQASDDEDVRTEEINATMWTIQFGLKCGDLPPVSERDVLFLPFESIEVIDTFSTEESFLGIPGGAAVVMCNRHVGFGASGTQEEIHVGASPEACLAPLLCPPLADDEVLIVRGAEPMVEIEGYGRSARLKRILPRFPTLEGSAKWANRTMLFMDALELDHNDASQGIPDLKPGNVHRELRKAYVAFSSGAPGYGHVVTGLWGCGAFGGNAEVKTIIQWCVASLAGVKLRYVLGREKEEFAGRLREFVREVGEREVKVRRMIEILESLQPDDIGEGSIFAYVLSKLEMDV